MHVILFHDPGFYAILYLWLLVKESESGHFAIFGELFYTVGLCWKPDFGPHG